MRTDTDKTIGRQTPKKIKGSYINDKGDAVLEPGKTHFKYVISYNEEKEPVVRVVSGSKFHTDCIVPGYRAESAGWVSMTPVDFDTGVFENIEVWGHSVGLSLYPQPEDKELLKDYFSLV